MGFTLLNVQAKGDFESGTGTTGVETVTPYISIFANWMQITGEGHVC